MVVSMVLAGCGSEPTPGGRAVIGPSLPDTVAGLSATGEPERFDIESIFAYIDGHAEVYMAYGFRRAVSQRYLSPEGDEVVVDLFELASTADAFGVFSHDRAGEPVDVGNGGVYRFGWLSFWQGNWAGSLYWDGDREPDRETLLELGIAAAAALPSGGAVPDLVARLPGDRLDRGSVCYLRSPQILNAHVGVGGGDPFALTGDAEAVVGRYELDGRSIDLVLVRYPDEAAAAAVETALRQHDETDTGRPAMVVGRRGEMLAAIVGNDTGEVGDDLIETALGGKG
jgi:hypothetical protein